jgi:hypothetical protein
MADSTASHEIDAQPPPGLAARWDEPFRFMDLPAELRLMVYEFLPREIKHYAIRATPTKESDRGPPPVTFVKKAVPTSILAICKAVYTEANAIVQRTIETFILESTQIISGASGWPRQIRSVGISRL